MRVLLFLVVLLVLNSSVLGETEGAGSQELSGSDGGEATGRSSSPRAPDKYKLTCDDARTIMGDIMYFNDEVKDVFSDFKGRYESDIPGYIRAKVELSE